MTSSIFENLVLNEDPEILLSYLLKAEADGYEFLQEANPEAIMRKFYTCKTNSEKIADVMIRCFGIVLVCRDVSFKMQRFMTILDSLSMDIDYGYSEFKERIMDLGIALCDEGARHAHEWDHEILLNLYKKDGSYAILPAFEKINKYFELDNSSIATDLDDDDDDDDDEELLNPFKSLWNRIT